MPCPPRRTRGSRVASGPHGQLAERAHIAGGGRPARGAGAEVGPLLGGSGCEHGRRPLQESEVEGVLRTGRLQLDLVQRTLVAEVLVAGRHRAFLDLVVDAAEHAVRSRLSFTDTNERLDLAGEPVRSRQNRELATEIVDRPAQDVAEENRSLVVEIVTGGDDVVPTVERGLIEEVPLREPACRARHPPRGAGTVRDIEAVAGREVDLDELQAAGLDEVADEPAGVIGILLDAQAEVETVDVVPELDQQVPECE